MDSNNLRELVDAVPALFLIGAAKSGTTSLHGHLSTHHQIMMAEAKETFFFSDDKLYCHGIDWYLAYHYANINPETHRYFGESCGMYSMCHICPEVVGRIHRFKPDSFFLYLLRDPVERAISHYWHHVRLGIETRPIEEAVVDGSCFLLSSDYSLQIKAYLKRFPLERFLFSFTEALRRDSGAEMGRITAWLGVEPTVAAATPAIQRNVTPDKITLTRGDTWLGRLKASKLWREHLRYLVPGPIRAVGKYHAVAIVDRKDPDIRQAEARVRDRIRPICERSTRELETMLSTTIEVWDTLRPDLRQ